MHESDDATFKAEIDQIIKNIDATMKKIEKIVPFKKEKCENSESDIVTET